MWLCGGAGGGCPGTVVSLQGPHYAVEGGPEHSCLDNRNCRCEENDALTLI